MASEHTPQEQYHADVCAYLGRRLMDTQGSENGLSTHSSPGCGEQTVSMPDKVPGIVRDEACTEIREAESFFSLPGRLGALHFSGMDDERRHMRLRCAIALAAFNAQPLSVSMQDRARAWHEYIAHRRFQVTWTDALTHKCLGSSARQHTAEPLTP